MSDKVKKNNKIAKIVQSNSELNLELAELSQKVFKEASNLGKRKSSDKSGIDSNFGKALSVLYYKSTVLHFNILILLGFDQIQSSAILLRSLFEIWVYIKWIKKDKKRAQAYNLFLNDYLESLKLLTTGDHKDIKPKRWKKEGIKEILKELKLDYWYGTYIFLCNFTHSNIGSFDHIFSKKEKEMTMIFSSFNLNWSFDNLKEFSLSYNFNKDIKKQINNLELRIKKIGKIKSKK